MMENNQYSQARPSNIQTQQGQLWLWFWHNQTFRASGIQHQSIPHMPSRLQRGYHNADQYVNRDALVTIWGHFLQGGLKPTLLQKVTVKTLSSRACQNTKYREDYITPRMICAANPGNDSWPHGDSGGPLSVLINGATYFELVGVVSWGEGCAEPGHPGVDARVTAALSWIKLQV